MPRITVAGKISDKFLQQCKVIARVRWGFIARSRAGSRTGGSVALVLTQGWAARSRSTLRASSPRLRSSFMSSSRLTGRSG